MYYVVSIKCNYRICFVMVLIIFCGTYVPTGLNIYHQKFFVNFYYNDNEKCTIDGIPRSISYEFLGY